MLICCGYGFNFFNRLIAVGTAGIKMLQPLSIWDIETYVHIIFYYQQKAKSDIIFKREM